MHEVIDTRIAYETRWTRLREDSLRYADGMVAPYSYIERPRFAIIAAIEDGCLWMVEQYRHPIRSRSLELPMGTTPAGDAISIEETARIELREETGLSAMSMRYVGDIAPLAPLLAQYGAIFLATGLTPGPQALEPTEEDLVARRLPVDEVLARIVSGEIQDGVAIAAIGLLRLKGLL